MIHSWLRSLKDPIPFTKGDKLAVIFTNVALLALLLSGSLNG